MSFIVTSMFVCNPAETAEFYQQLLGMKILRRQKTPEHELIFLGFNHNNETQLELISCSPEDAVSARGISIGFSVPDLDKTLERIPALGGKVLSGIISPVPSVRFCFIADINGMRVQLFG